MGLGDFWLQFNNGKKEQLNDTKHGVRKEQVDKKFHNLFDAYDINNDGTLEENEVQTIFGHLKNFAGDNVLDSAENLKAKSVFADQVNMQDVDFQGFVKSVSDATSNIISSEETKTSDGGKEIKTEYKDGTTETIAYYSNGDFKWKKIEKRFAKTTYEMILDGKRQELTEEQYNQALKKLNEKPQPQQKPKATFGIEGQNRIVFPQPTPSVEVKTTTNKWEEHTQEYSPRFIAEKLGVDINTDEGKKILERMSYLPKEALDQIKDGAELKDIISKNDLPPNFDNISNVLELIYGVTLRNEDEYEASKPQREKIVQQIQTVGIMSELYARVAEFNDTYTDNQGLFGMGAEGIGYLLNKVGIQGENHYQWADSCREFIEKINDFKVLNPAKFEEEFKGLTGKEKFNVEALQKMVELAKDGKAQDEYGNYTEEFKQAVKDFSNFDVSNPNAKAWYHPDNLLNGFGEALIMIMTLGWGAETKAGQMLATSTMATFSKAGVAIASRQVNNKLLQGALRYSGQAVKLLGPAINEGTKMYTYTAVMGTASNVANRVIKYDSEENTLDKFLDTEAMVLDSATGSFGFGAFAGVFGSTVTQKVMQRASRVSQKVGTALSDKFAKGAVDANEVFTTILEKSAPTKIAEVAAFVTDVLGFTAFESVLAIVKNLDNYPEGYSVEDLTNIIWEELKSQGYNLGQIKIVVWLMSSRSARMQATRYIKDAMPQLRGATVEGVNGGKDGYKINLPDGRKIECKNTTEYISTLHLMVRGETAFSKKFDVRNTNRGSATSDVVIPTTQNETIEQRLEQANDRESFVAIRDEIKKMPNGEEKTQLMQAYLKKYNEWSADPSRPDIRMQYIPENETINLDIKKVQETLNILSQKKGLKDIKDEVKNEIAKLVGNSLPENQDQMIKLIYKLKNAKEWWGEKTQEYNDEQLLQIIKTASNPDDSLNLIVLQRICRRMDGGPREDNSNMTRILPRDTKELNLARRSDGFFDEDLVLIGKKLTYAHDTREEIFKLLKDENGNPIKDLVDLVLTDKSENFNEGDMILGVLKSLYTDGKLDLNKVNQMTELVKDGSVSIYRAAHTMQSDMPADIIQNIGVFTQKGLSNNEVTNVINYLKSQNIKPTFDSVKNIIENCGNIPELRDIHVKKLLNQRGESIDKSYYEYVKKIAQHIEQIKQVYPEKANQFPKDIVASYIKLLQIDGRSVQLKQHEIIELLYDRGKDTCPFDIDKLVDSGLLSDIPGRDKPLQPRDLMRYQKEDTEVLKKAISRGFLSGNYSKILSLRKVPSGVMTSGGGKSKLEQLVELSDSELQFLQSMNTSDMLFGTAIGLAKCNPEQVKFLLETMNTHGSQYFANNYLRDSNFDLAYKMFKEIDAKMENHTTELTPQIACRILHFVNSENKYDAQNLFDNRQELGISADKIPSMLENKITKKQIQKAIKVTGKSKIAKLSNSDFVIACQFADLYGKKNINEIPLRNKRDLLRSLVSSNRGLFEISEELSKDFPLLPKNQEEYCSLLPSIVRSLGIETNELTPEQRITMFNSSMGELSKSLAELSDADFSQMSITQEYPKDKFILDVLDKVKTLPRTERQKVYDYFGFELHHNKENSTGFSITGYPVNLNNGKKLAQIEDPKTKAVVEDLRPNVIRFSENNKIKCNNPQVERFLNEVIEALPELRTTIGKKQHGAQAFDVMQHSLKVMQKIAQDPKFETLNESDQKIMLLASLMHDIAKAEGSVDKQHANYGSFDSFFIAQKFNLTKEEEVKLHTLIKHHEWLEQVNTAKSEEQLKKRLQSVAYDLQQGNLFDMAEIFTHADLKAVKVDDSFHDTTEGRSRVGFDGTVRSFGESANVYAERIRSYIKELQKSQPLLPQTKVPRASRINEAITQVNPDGSTNIKGVYKDKDGLIVIKFNEVEDWETIGFPKGSISHGIEIKKGEKGDAELSEDVNTGNIKFFVHGLNYSNQLAKFDAFSLVDSDALLSVSYAERPESKFRFFRPQGVLLDVNSKYIHGGGNTDSGSGCGKDIAEFKKNYIFGGRREYDRLYVSDLIKKTTCMTDEQYVEFVEINKDKPIQEIEPVEIRDKIVKAFATINSNTRKGKREYNEMYISNPNEVMGVFAYSIDYTEKIDNPVKFLNRNTVGEHEESYGGAGNISVKERTEFLRQYALERNLPFIIFGD